MQKKKNIVLQNIEITAAGAEGKAVARVDGKVLFMSYGAVGDIVDVEVYRKKNSYMEGRITTIHAPSVYRVEPVCKHFGLCGGCKWQHVSYQHQLAFKQDQVVNNLTRIGKLDLTEVSPIIGSEKITHYRNKLEFTFSDRRWLEENEKQFEAGSSEVFGLGFHIPGRFDKVLDLIECHLQPEPSNTIRLSMKQFAVDKGYTFNNLRDHKGFLRNLIIRNTSLGDLMIIVVFGEDNVAAINDTMNFLYEKFPEITSLQYTVNTKCNDDISDLEVYTFKGASYMTEKMGHLSFKIGPKSFFQTNIAQAIKLYDVTRNLASIQPHELVYDLYTGTGTIANYVAHQAKQVIGLEYVEQAIANAKENSTLNSIENTIFLAGDMAKIFNDDLIATYGKPDVVITDPPRAGMHADVVARLLQYLPERIVYVSCNSATQARDLELMKEYYVVKAVQPVDMFPHTHHVENVVLLHRK